ncbi:MAG: hypothetical protein WDW21_06250 [Neisseriaceae bacterium]
MEFEKKHSMSQEIEVNDKQLIIKNPWKNYAFDIVKNKKGTFLKDKSGYMGYRLKMENKKVVLMYIDYPNQKFIFTEK